MLSFQCSLGYQLPLFLAHKDDVAIHSVHSHLRQCHKVWRDAYSALLCSILLIATRILHPTISLVRKDIPLKTKSKKLSPHYIGPFEIESIINPSAVKLTHGLHHPAATDYAPQCQGFQYFVDWEGYYPKECTWILHSFILDPSLI